jgi:hypothetical protein
VFWSIVAKHDLCSSSTLSLASKKIAYLSTEILPPCPKRTPERGRQRSSCDICESLQDLLEGWHKCGVITDFETEVD